jgi:hypothetical protein
MRTVSPYHPCLFELFEADKENPRNLNFSIIYAANLICMAYPRRMLYIPSIYSILAHPSFQSFRISWRFGFLGRSSFPVLRAFRSLGLSGRSGFPSFQLFFGHSSHCNQRNFKKLKRAQQFPPLPICTCRNCLLIFAVTSGNRNEIISDHLLIFYITKQVGFDRASILACSLLLITEYIFYCKRAILFLSSSKY